MRKHESLRTRVTLSFISLAIGPLIVVGVLIAWLSFHAQFEQTLALQDEMARRASSRILEFLSTLEGDLYLSLALMNLLAKDPDEPQKAVSALLTHEYNEFGAVFETIALIDGSGQEIAKASRLADDMIARRQQRTEDAAFLHPMRTGTSYYSQVSFHPVSGEPSMTLAVPIPDIRRGVTKGVLIAQIRLKMMRDTVKQIDLGGSGQAYILDAQHRVIVHENPSVVLRGTFFNFTGETLFGRGLDSTWVVLSGRTLQLGEHTFRLVIEMPVGEALALTFRTLGIISVLMIFALAAATGLGFQIIRQIARPIEALAVAAKSIERGDLSRRVIVTRHDELGALAEAFNSMAARLHGTINSLKQHAEELEQSSTALREIGTALNESLAKEKELGELQSRFISMVSHEFRTPLTSIRSSTEILDRYGPTLTEEKKHQHFSRIQGNVDTMIRLLDDVLFIGNVESGKLKISATLTHLRQFCEEIVEEVTVTCSQLCPVQVSYQLKHEMPGVDERLLRHILVNLLSNAVKYSPRGSPVTLDVTETSATLTFRIADQGIGIPQSDQPSLFEAFHRADNVGNISGTGLGLSIVKHCVELYQGTLDFSSQEGQGTTFTVSLPLPE